jgi:nucleotide-binding universal stress UspA family protein
MRSHPKILIASDMTARSDRPFDRAVRLAKQRQGSLVLLHVVDETDRVASALPLDRTRLKIIAQLPPVDVPLEVVVRIGSAPECIANTAAGIQADLIVVGPARFNDLRDFLLGTAVDYLVRRATVPVLVVKKRPLADYRTALIATDFSPCSAHAAVTAAEMLPHAQLVLFHAFVTPFPSRADRREMLPFAQNRAREDMAAFLASDAMSGVKERLLSEIEEGLAATVVDRRIREAGIDLLVVGTHGSSGLQHALLGGRASQLLTEASCDVLMVREMPAAKT